jgi:glycosyltransferase involved in cell wall biosynthesis
MHSTPATPSRPNTAIPHRGTIALVANMAWSIYNFRLPVIRALQAEGYRVVVIAPVDETVSKLLREPGVEFVSLQQFKRNSTSIVASIKMLREFKQILGKLKPNLVIHYGVQANVWGNLGAAWAGIPSVCVVTGLGYTFLHNGFVPRLTRWLYRFSFLRTACVLFENQEDLDLMVARRMILRNKTRHVPGCGIDTEHFAPIETGLHNEGPVFTLLGRLLYDKGLREFAHAAQRLKAAYPTAECWVLGHLDDQNPAHIRRSELVEWVQQGFIHYKGATDDVRPTIAQSDWMVLPSYREGLSKVLLEAMSMAKPIITTDTAGCRETVIPGENGFLVPVKDGDALFKIMLECCSISVQKRQEMGQIGREKAISTYGAALVGKVYVALADRYRNQQ